jgi:hypothetical protein
MDKAVIGAAIKVNKSKRGKFFCQLQGGAGTTPHFHTEEELFVHIGETYADIWKDKIKLNPNINARTQDIHDGMGTSDHVADDANKSDSYDPEKHLLWQQKDFDGFLLGWKNHRNTCFMNATLQCLVFLPCFAQVFMNKRISVKEDKPCMWHFQR